ncbi:hypothetical protein BDV59DRAFT_205144 [Aspergillus ambiguus]|uniref:uncharacterized protein n=1 Tax=Aspergillus ambiguus TaxID=176160 RepID=UPI003CCCD4BC
MQFSFVFLLVASFLLLPFISAHSLVPKSTLNSCQHLDRLNNTVNRVSPLLEKLLHDHDQRTKHTHTHGNSTGAVGQKRDAGDLISKIQAFQGLLGQSQEKILSKMLSCQEPAVSARGLQAHVAINKTAVKNVENEAEAEVDSDSDSDSDDEDDGMCSLEDVLESLVDTLECLLSFTFSLLGGVLDMVTDLLGGILHLVGSLLDLE